MSVSAIDHVWDVQDVSAQEKLALLWLANQTADLGDPVCPDWISLGQFMCCHYAEAFGVVSALIAKGLVIQGSEEEDETAHLYWLVYDGPYSIGGFTVTEPRNRSRRVAALIERDGAACRYCEKTPVIYEVDHFIPRAKGGADNLNNLVLSCVPCNRAKRDQMPEEFLADRPKLLRSILATFAAYSE